MPLHGGLTKSQADALYLALTGGTLTGDLLIGANRIKTTNLLLKETSADRMGIRNVADSYNLDFEARKIAVNLGLLVGDGGKIYVDGDSGTQSALFQSYNGGALRTAAKLLAGNFELAYAKLTGTVDCNNQILKDLKNTTGALSGTKKVVEIDIGGTPYYFEVYPTKA